MKQWEIEYLRNERITSRFPCCINKGLTWISEMRGEATDATAEQLAELDKMSNILITLSCKKKITIEYNDFYDDFLHIFCCMQRRLRKRNGKEYATYFFDNKYYLELYPEEIEEGEEV